LIALGVAAVLSVALLVESWMQSVQRTRDRRPLHVAAPIETIREPETTPAAGRTGSDLPDGLIGAARDVEPQEPDVREEADLRTEDEIDLTGDGHVTPSATEARQPGRARAKPRPRSGTSS
jgi:hypothetical protein